MNRPKWKQIPDFPNLKASGDGQVANRLVTLTSTPDASGRKYIVVKDAEGNRRNMAVGSLVLLAFKGPPPEGKNRVVYLDGDTTNDQAGNLKWGDRVEQAAARPTKNRTNPTDAQYRAAHRGMVQSGQSLRAVAHGLGVSRDTLTHALDRLRLKRPTRKAAAA